MAVYPVPPLLPVYEYAGTRVVDPFVIVATS